MVGILRVLEEIALAEADSDWHEPPIPVIHVGERLAGLLGRLRSYLQVDKEGPFVPDAPDFSRPPTEAQSMPPESAGLLAELREIVELTGLTYPPASSWSQIENRFRRFVGSFHRHRAGRNKPRPHGPSVRDGG